MAGGGLTADEIRRAAQDGRPICIRGGIVADGTGDPLRAADVLIAGGRVIDVAAPGCIGMDNALEIDATNQIVAPGFIDVHSHADNAPLLAEDDTTKILQGVTTEVVGNCGFSLAPVHAAHAAQASAFLGRIFPPIALEWKSFAELFAATDAAGYVTNYVPLVGHSTLRLATLGMVDRVSEAGELRTMTLLLEDALADGAFGLSSGLIYPPGMFAESAELVTLARALTSGRVYATHMRGEGAHLMESVSEAVAVAEQADCRVQVSHLKSAGRPNWGRVGEALDFLGVARARGLLVGQDAYPYDASSTMLAACLPPWFQEGGNDAVLARLTDRGALERARVDIESGPKGTWENHVSGAGWSGILLAITASHRNEGWTLAEIAEQQSIDPFDALVQVLVDERLRASMIIFSLSEADVEAVLSDPATMVGSDGTAPGKGGRPHPRLYGCFPRVLGRYVRERKLLDMTSAIVKMTSLPADAFGLAGRGRVTAGSIADLVVFSADSVGDVGTYTDPVHSPKGISSVLIAGCPVVFQSEWLGIRRGCRVRP